MIRMIQSISSEHAQSYYTAALSQADYYINDQELAGQLQGKLAERLGISGPVSKEVFFDLCENRNPLTQGALTARTREERTVGYDINFHAPKSVSILHALSNDDQLLEAFQDAVRQTMLDIEADAQTRVRKKDAQTNRPTGELLWADFIHQTARPVEGHTPDPHLHAHCFVFNATHDPEENQIKAVQFRDIKRDMPYYQARFHKRLSDHLIDQGYQIRRTAKSFEVVGVPQPVVELFSKRTDEIGRIAKEKGITDAKELSELGARTRAKKQHGHSMAELKADWRRQIRELPASGRLDGTQAIRHAPVREKSALTVEQCVDHAIGHGFERASVLQDRRLLEAAYRHSIGHRSLTLDAVNDRFGQDERLIQVQDDSRTLCTTKAVLAEEQHMVQLARQDQGKLKPLYRQTPELTLDGQQAEAIRHVLTTTNRVSIIRGAAGSGKTTLMREAIDHIEKTGKRVLVVAPSSEASRNVLRNEGFAEAETVAKLLLDEKLQQQLNNKVLWVDEAGLLGTGDMTALLELSRQQNARLILGGDTRQHSSVIRGDALRILNTVGGIQTAEVSRIYRQKQVPYRQAVEALAKGNVKGGFAQLQSIGAIQEVDPLKPHEQLVQDYIQTIQAGKTALVVSPTHEESDKVTQLIREQLKDSGVLGKKELTVARLSNLNLTQAQKADWRNFQVGQVVQFNQNRPGIKRGSQWTVEHCSADGVFIRHEEETIQLPVDRSGEYELYQASELNLAKGDQVRITRNGFDQRKNRLHNGQLLEVVKVGKFSPVVLRNPISKAEYQLDQQYGHLSHAYCITSHASQGKTVDEVFIAQPAATFPGTDAKQFYVSVSRGRERARIYTDDQDTLLSYASRMGDRQSAIELVQHAGTTTEFIEHHIRQEMSRTPPKMPQAKPVSKPKEAPSPVKPKDRPYEPQF